MVAIVRIASVPTARHFVCLYSCILQSAIAIMNIVKKIEEKVLNQKIYVLEIWTYKSLSSLATFPTFRNKIKCGLKQQTFKAKCKVHSTRLKALHTQSKSLSLAGQGFDPIMYSTDLCKVKLCRRQCTCSIKIPTLDLWVMSPTRSLCASQQRILRFRISLGNSLVNLAEFFAT